MFCNNCKWKVIFKNYMYKKGIKEAHVAWIKSVKVLVTEDEVRGLRGVSKSLAK